MMTATGRESTQGHKGLQAINDRSSFKKNTFWYNDYWLYRYNEVIDYVNQKQQLVSLRSQIGCFVYFVFDVLFEEENKTSRSDGLVQCN
jgi:hypothetical protein